MRRSDREGARERASPSGEAAGDGWRNEKPAVGPVFLTFSLRHFTAPIPYNGSVMLTGFFSAFGTKSTGTCTSWPMRSLYFTCLLARPNS